MLRVITLSTLFPDETRPNFGVFVERQTRQLAALEEIDLKVIAPIGLPPWPFSRQGHYKRLADIPLEDAWKGLDVRRPRFSVLPATGGRFHVRGLVRALVPLLDDLRGQFPFDVIDAQFFFPDGPAAIALGKRYDVPVSIKARGADIHHWGHGPTARQVRKAGERADGLLAVSDAMKRDMAELGMPGERIRVHRTGVDLDCFTPIDRAAAKAQWGVCGPVVVSLGALIPRKGHEIVIDAVASIPDVTLLIAGEGPERARLTAQIMRLNVGDRVRLLGSIPHESLPGLLAAADVMALASSSEGLANAWVEALACGTPIVVTATGGADEVVTAHAAGRIAQRNRKAFAEAIGDLIANAPERSATRALAAHFTWGRNGTLLAKHLATLHQQQAAKGRRQ